jgi:hypothetical protein
MRCYYFSVAFSGGTDYCNGTWWRYHLDLFHDLPFDCLWYNSIKVFHIHNKKKIR